MNYKLKMMKTEVSHIKKGFFIYIRYQISLNMIELQSQLAVISELLSMARIVMQLQDKQSQ